MKKEKEEILKLELCNLIIEGLINKDKNKDKTTIEFVSEIVESNFDNIMKVINM